jgi:hypothetical protein
MAARERKTKPPTSQSQPPQSSHNAFATAVTVAIAKPKTSGPPHVG